MQLRSITSGVAFQPQYKMGEGEWCYFTNEHIGKGNLMQELCQSLADIGFRGIRTWGQHPYCTDSGHVFFTSHMLCNAFLGAAKLWFDPKTTEFNLD